MEASLSHFHIKCPDKFELANWYVANLGFVIHDDVEARGEKEGPVFISADGGKTGIAIFTLPSGAEPPAEIKCIPAFEVSPDSFVEFHGRRKLQVPETTVYDHFVSFSIYLLDPTGTKIEILCSRYAAVGALLKKAGIVAKRMNPSHDPAYQNLQR